MVKLVFGNRDPPRPPTPAPGAEQPVPVPQVVKEMGDFLEAAMPTIEKFTGVSRREITFALLKGGLKGGSLDAILTGLMGRPAVQEAKFVRIVKTLVIWVPVGIGLTGVVLISLIFFAKLALMLWGTL